MLDAFEIITTSGIVLWRKEYAPVSSSVVNSLINDVFIEQRGQKNRDGGSNPPYRKDKYTLRWTSAKDVGLIFVVGKSFGRDNTALFDVLIDFMIGRVPKLASLKLG